MNIFKAFGITKHWPTQREWEKHQRGLEREDEVVEQPHLDEEQVSQYFEDQYSGLNLDERAYEKPYLTAEEARKAGIFLDREPDPEPGTFPPKPGMKTGSMMNEPIGQAPTDPEEWRGGRQPSRPRI